MNDQVDPIVEEERQANLYDIRILGISPWRLILPAQAARPYCG
jgi:hypothetical protein